MFPEKLSVCFASLTTFFVIGCARRMEKTRALLTPFNYFEWKVKMVIQLRSRGLYWVTMGTENESNYAVEKAKYFNRIDEEFGMIFLDTSRELLFHI